LAIKQHKQPFKKVTHYGVGQKGGTAKIERTDQGYPQGVFSRILEGTRDDKGYITKFRILNEKGDAAFLEVGHAKCLQLEGRYSHPGVGVLVVRVMDPRGVIKQTRIKTGGYQWGFELKGLIELYSLMKELNELGSWDRYLDLKKIERLRLEKERLQNKNDLLRKRINQLKAQLAKYQEEE
jgi:hypothetical protein